MAIQELFFDEQYEDGPVLRKDKGRLFKCVDRKGNFLWWESQVIGDVVSLTETAKKHLESMIGNLDNFSPEQQVGVFLKLSGMSEGFGIEATSGYCDFSENGDSLELTQEDRDRALKRKVKL